MNENFCHLRNHIIWIVRCDDSRSYPTTHSTKPQIQDESHEIDIYFSLQPPVDIQKEIIWSIIVAKCLPNDIQIFNIFDVIARITFSGKDCESQFYFGKFFCNFFMMNFTFTLTPDVVVIFATLLKVSQISQHKKVFATNLKLQTLHLKETSQSTFPQAGHKEKKKLQLKARKNEIILIMLKEQEKKYSNEKPQLLVCVACWFNMGWLTILAERIQKITMEFTWRNVVLISSFFVVVFFIKSCKYLRLSAFGRNKFVFKLPCRWSLLRSSLNACNNKLENK